MAETVAETVAEPGAEQCAAQINKTKGQTALGVGAVAPPPSPTAAPSLFIDTPSWCASVCVSVCACVCASTFGIGTWGSCSGCALPKPPLLPRRMCTFKCPFPVPSSSAFAVPNLARLADYYSAVEAVPLSLCPAARSRSLSRSHSRAYVFHMWRSSGTWERTEGQTDSPTDWLTDCRDSVEQREEREGRVQARRKPLAAQCKLSHGAGEEKREQNAHKTRAKHVGNASSAMSHFTPKQIGLPTGFHLHTCHN